MLYKNSEFFYVITDETYIDNYKNKLEVIINNVSEDIFDILKIESTFFEFNEITGLPIINVNAIIYNEITDRNSYAYLNPKSDIGNKRFHFDNSRNKYVFNILELKLPSKINKAEIIDVKFPGNFNIFFIYDVRNF